VALLSGISKLNRAEILALANAFTLVLSEGLDDQDLNTAGNLLMTIGSLIVTFPSLGENDGSR